MSNEYECGDCGMQSDDWAEFAAHCQDRHCRNVRPELEQVA